VNQMMLAVTVADESNRVEPDARYDVEVADSTGQKWFRSAAFGSAADGDPTRRATVNWFEPDAAPAAPGTRQLTVVISHVQLTQPLEVASSAGPLPTIAPTGDDAQLEATFRFDLPVLPGAEASPNASAEHDGVTVTLSHVVVSPSMIRADVRWTGMPADTTGWTPGAGVWQHDGRTVAENWGSGRCEPTVCWLTTAGYQGSDTQQGQWTLTIDSFKGGSVKDIDTNTTGELPLVVAHGPFLIRFTIP
jgi:hypothetical protein